MTFTFITAAFYLVGVASFRWILLLEESDSKSQRSRYHKQKEQRKRELLLMTSCVKLIQMLRDEMEQRENEALARVATHVQLYYENESLKAKEILDKYIAFVQQEIDSTSQELFQFRNEVEVIQKSTC